MTPPRFLAAISTPYADDGSVALDAFSEHVAWLAGAGLDGDARTHFEGLRDVIAADDHAAGEAVQQEIATAKAEVECEGSTVAAVKRRVAAQLPGYPAAPRAPFA